jgi:arylsulfatase A-like enzyme
MAEGRCRCIIAPLAALAAVLTISPGCGAPGEARVNVVLIVVDALRADHLGCYGYPLDTSPFLDSLAGAGMRWSRVQAQSSWTLPGVSSIMTGLDARTHGAGRHGTDILAFDAATPTVATVLHSDGYECAAFMNVYLLSADFGFHRGYERFRCHDLGNGRAAATVDSCITWLGNRDGSGPMLLTMHLFDPHDPYDPPGPYDTLFARGPDYGLTDWVFEDHESPYSAEELRDILSWKYDGEIRWVDTELGRFFRWLRENGYSDNTVIVVTADHGEEFLEHGGFGHGKTMFQEVLNIPLIIAGPGIGPGISDGLACQMDILPTILALTGSPAPDGLPGRDLLAPPGDDRFIPSSNVNSGLVPVVASVRRGDDKVIWDATSDTAVSFDLAADPGEREPLRPDSSLVQAVLYYWATPPAGLPLPVDRGRIDRALRDLGYI